MFKCVYNLRNTEAAPVANDNEYGKLKRKLDNHLLPKKNKQTTSEQLQSNKMGIFYFNSKSSLNEIRRLWFCLFFGNCNFYNKFEKGISCRPIPSVIVTRNSRSSLIQFCSLVMITDGIGLHSVLLPLLITIIVVFVVVIVITTELALGVFVVHS